jgi:hypothetical protein
VAKKRSEQLEQEIREALSRIPKKSLKTREQLDAEIDAILASGLPAERYEVAQALGYRYPKKPPPRRVTLTPLNLSVLGQIARGRKEFPNQITAVSAPHVRRAIKAGAVEVVDKTRLRITPFGYESLMDYIATRSHRDDILPPTGEFTPEVFE